ncbi:MAG: AAA family ATPase [Chloroflexi bacterium]|nr:AAA family ATPase [Chloroflexota bacterium]MCI0578451.1 AAA family ATPase [Chloroflexota bacterium]MCI0643897.1 AAA family ATPase [Chloroflexota bacterium]MCI0729193.1 AAA family ATPase [Chloroflexota bacterium]
MLPTRLQPLPADRLRRVCQHNHFTFETTAEIETAGSIVGQPRGTRAIEFGIGIRSQGYNIYVLGETGTGRTTAIRRFLEERADDQPVPDDWVYVHNFAVPHRPRAIHLPPGHGLTFQEDIAELVNCLREDLPKAFDTDAYREAAEQLGQSFGATQQQLLGQLKQEAARQGFTVVETPSGLAVVPLSGDKVMDQATFDQLSVEQRQQLDKQQQALNDRLEAALRQVRQLGDQARQQLKQLDQQVAAAAIAHHFEELRQVYAQYEEVLVYLNEVEQDAINHLHDFQPGEEGGEEPDLSRYAVNLLVDNSKTRGTPVVVENTPTYHNLIGRIEHEMRHGVLFTHFSNIMAGSLHRANGGYLVVNARDFLHYSLAWEALKRAIETELITIQPADILEEREMAVKSLDPEPIPLKVKVILMGSPNLYYALHEQDEEFSELFKVKADFDTVMQRDDANEYEYASFIAHRCREEGLRHFDRPAVEKVVEYGSRLSGDQNKLSTRFGLVTDLIREASYWATKAGRDVVAAQDVQRALDESIYRANLLEERFQEQISDGTVFIDTQGAVVGQVNGLSVLDMGDYSFGHPNRITARTYMGESGVVHIEREVEMAGPLHNKGVLTLTGYLGGIYAQKQPLSLSASLTFEQNYGDIDGDSASAAELFALLSGLSELPIQQGIAVTGSVNQRGEIQPIGGVTEKVEGFFAACKAQGLNGKQGVIIPATNIRHLMLREEIVEAVAAGQFHIWAIRTVDEGLELLTGTTAGERDETGHYPEGTIHHTVQNRLLQLAQELKAFGDKDEH